MKYTEASAQVMELDNQDVVCSLISGDDIAAAVDQFFTNYGNHLNSNEREKMIGQFANGAEGFAKMLNEYGSNLSEAELGEILQNSNKFGKWVTQTCGNTAHSYSSDTEDGFFDNEVGDNETDW